MTFVVYSAYLKAYAKSWHSERKKKAREADGGSSKVWSKYILNRVHCSYAEIVLQAF